MEFFPIYPFGVYADGITFEMLLSLDQVIKRLESKLHKKKTTSFFCAYLVGSVAADRFQFSRASSATTAGEYDTRHRIALDEQTQFGGAESAI